MPSRAVPVSWGRASPRDRCRSSDRLGGLREAPARLPLACTFLKLGEVEIVRPDGRVQRIGDAPAGEIRAVRPG